MDLQLLQALGTASTTAAGGPVAAFVKPLTLTLAQFADAASALVVGIAALCALLTYSGAILGLLFGRVDAGADRGAGVPKEQIRLALGRSLALEFELGPISCTPPSPRPGTTSCSWRPLSCCGPC